MLSRIVEIGQIRAVETGPAGGRSGPKKSGRGWRPLDAPDTHSTDLETGRMWRHRTGRSRLASSSIPILEKGSVPTQRMSCLPYRTVETVDQDAGAGARARPGGDPAIRRYLPGPAHEACERSVCGNESAGVFV